MFKKRETIFTSKTQVSELRVAEMYKRLTEDESLGGRFGQATRQWLSGRRALRLHGRNHHTQDTLWGSPGPRTWESDERATWRTAGEEGLGEGALASQPHWDRVGMTTLGARSPGSGATEQLLGRSPPSPVSVLRTHGKRPNRAPSVGCMLQQRRCPALGRPARASEHWWTVFIELFVEIRHMLLSFLLWQFQ